MFDRNILKLLAEWKNSSDRKPLIIRGARQTGKTVAIEIFAKNFQSFVSLNLEREEDKQLFEKCTSFEELIKSIELAKRVDLAKEDTILFIDEIQNSEKAIKFLRFFCEDMPKLAVVGAGSLLEVMMQKEGFSFPVGRVTFLYLHPVSFDEFILACGNKNLYETLKNVSIKEGIPPSLHRIASDQFMKYVIVGGMPASVKNFLETESYQSTMKIKEELVTAFEEDASKYAERAQTKYLRHVITHAPQYVGERIKYENFGGSGFHSREMKSAFDILENAMLIQRVWGSPSILPPLRTNFRASPKLLYLDVGLVLFKAGLIQPHITSQNLDHLFRGKIAEQIVGQALKSLHAERNEVLHFWYRDKSGAKAETDYLVQLENELLPIEVKSGKTGSLRSLHQFVIESGVKRAIRFYSGELRSDNISVQDKSYQLLSIPLYLLWRFRDLSENSSNSSF